MASKAQYNVGTFKGLLGTAVIYLIRTSGGTDYLAYKSSVTVGGVTSDKWTFMPKSALQSYMASGDATVSSNVSISTLPETLPEGTLDANGYPIIDNGESLPRLYTSQAFYSLKGEGIADFTGDKGTPTSGNKDSGTSVVINSAGKTLSETITEVTTWVSKNFILAAFILIAALELFGITHILESMGGGKKKTAKARARR